MGEAAAQHPEVLPALVTALRDDHSDVRYSAAKALGEMGEAAALNYYRQDIGNIYGSQFNFSGYNRSVTGLLAGYYQMVAYANAPVSALTIPFNRFVYATWPY